MTGWCRLAPELSRLASSTGRSRRRGSPERRRFDEPPIICQLSVYLREVIPVARIRFTDTGGEKGVVDADLRVRYAGRPADRMAAFVGAFAEERGSSPPVPTLQSLAVALYAEFPLAEIGIVRGRDGRERTDLRTEGPIHDSEPLASE